MAMSSTMMLNSLALAVRLSRTCTFITSAHQGKSDYMSRTLVKYKWSASSICAWKPLACVITQPGGLTHES